MSSNRIEGRVAQVLTDRELVINRGESHGVEVGMRFAILLDTGVGITDPETNESLGDIERPKTLVKVSQVREKLCVASTYRTKMFGGAIAIPSLELFAPQVSVDEKLRADKDAYVQPLEPEESIVKRGDRAVQVIGDEFSGWDW